MNLRKPKNQTLVPVYTSDIELAGLLLEMGKISEMFGEQYAAANYFKASSHFSGRLPKYTPGEAMAKKIAEYRKTGKIRELVDIKKSQKYKSWSEFNKILGVGPSTIKKWIAAGIDNLVKLRQAIAKNQIKLTKIQQYGVRYYADLNTPIPRAEVELIGRRMLELLAEVANDINGSRARPISIIAEIAGSYRRGAPQSGDIDIVCGTEASPADVLLRLIAKLRHDLNFVEVLTAGPEKIMFLYTNGTVRQIDLICVAPDSYWTALAYLTGSWNHNETLRGIAKSKGYRLNQIGLYKGQVRVPITSEEDIYRELGLDYVAPKDRI